MDYETLRKYQRIERGSSSLSEISPTFYTDLVALIREYSEKYERGRSSEDAKTLDNIKKVALDVFERREQKIIMKALRCSHNKEMKENNVVETEKSLLESLLKSLRENREGFEQILAGERVTPAVDAADVLEEKIEAINGGSQDLNMVLVRILKNIPKFVSSDMTELGPFEANEIKRLPEKEAALLSEKKFAEII
jgi:DNA replication initiation complex subunit (GINS family)